MLLKVKKKNWDILVSPVQNLLELLQVIILLHWVSSVNSTDSYLVTLPVPVHYLSRSPWHFERKLIRLCEVKSETRSIRIFMNPSKNLLGFLFLAILDLTSAEGQFLASFIWMKKNIHSPFKFLVLMVPLKSVVRYVKHKRFRNFFPRNLIFLFWEVICHVCLALSFEFESLFLINFPNLYSSSIVFM